MSLINDMLKNLDRRQQRQDIAADLQPVQHTRQKSRITPAVVIAAALLAGLVAFAIERMWPRGAPGPEVTVAEAPAPEPDDRTSEPVIEVRAETESEPEPPPEAEPVAKSEPVAKPKPKPEPVPKSKPVAKPEPTPESEAAADFAKPEPKPQPEAAKPVPVQRSLRPTTPRDRADKAYATAVRHLSAGRRAQAEDALTEALGHYGAHHEARGALVNLLLGAGRTREAELMLQEGLRISPKHAPFADQYARILMRRDDLAAALGVLNGAAPAIESDPDYHALIAYLYQQAENHDTAADLYRELVAIRPGQGQWWLGLGMSLDALQHTGQALDAYRRARNDSRLGSEVLRFINTRIRLLDTAHGAND